MTRALERAAAGPDFSSEFCVDFLQLLRWRRDVRRFRREPLSDVLVRDLIATACLAPSVGLSEPWRFVLVDDPARRAAMRANFERSNAEALAAQADDKRGRYARLKLAGLDEAPCHLAVFADPGTGQGHGLGRRTMPETLDYSVVMAVHTLWLAARARGVGLGWVSILDPRQAKADLGVPMDWTLIGYLCLGFPAFEDVCPTLEREGWEQRRPTTSVVFVR